MFCPSPSCADDDPECGGEGQPCCEEDLCANGAEACCDPGFFSCGPQPDHCVTCIPEGQSCELDSDRNLKHDVRTISNQDVLKRLSALKITTWSYIDDTTRAKHLGPMAQDFHAAFGLGATDRTIPDMVALGMFTI